MGYILTTEGEQFTPEGIAGSCEGLNDEQIKQILFYRSFVTGADGARYELLKEKHHNAEAVTKAKQYIRHNFDPVQIIVKHEA